MSIQRQTLSPVIEIVVWKDAVSVDSWEDIGDLIKDVQLHTITTIGFVISEDKEKLMLAGNIDLHNECASCVMLIPKGWILKRKKVKA